jgi:endonuclease I
MHAIFAANSSVNGSRGNIPFGNQGKIVSEDDVGQTFLHEGRRYF